MAQTQPPDHPHHNFCLNIHCNGARFWRHYNSRAIGTKTKVKITLPDIVRNPLPPDKSLLLAPTPTNGSKIVRVERDSIRRFSKG